MLLRLPRASGAATATTGVACASAHSLRRASAMRRVITPESTTVAAIRTSARAVMRKPRRERTGCSGGMRFSDRRDEAFGVATVQDAENDRHKHQCSNRCKNETTDDGAAKWRILLAAFA